MPIAGSENRSNKDAFLWASQPNLEMARLSVAKRFSEMRAFSLCAQIQLLNTLLNKISTKQHININEEIELAYKNPAFETLLNKKLQAERQMQLFEEMDRIELSIQMKMQFALFQEIEAQKFLAEINLIIELEEEFKKKQIELSTASDQKSSAQLMQISIDMLNKLKELRNELNLQIEKYNQMLELISEQIRYLEKQQTWLHERLNQISNLIVDNIKNTFDEARNTCAPVKIELSDWEQDEIDELRNHSITPPKELDIDMKKLLYSAENMMIEKYRNNKRHESLSEDDKKQLMNDHVKYECKRHFKNIPINSQIEYKIQNKMAQKINPHLSLHLDHINKEVYLKNKHHHFEFVDVQEKIAQNDQSIAELKLQYNDILVSRDLCQEKIKNLDLEIQQLESFPLESLPESLESLSSDLLTDLKLDNFELPEDLLSGQGMFDVGTSDLDLAELLKEDKEPSDSTALLIASFNLLAKKPANDPVFPEAEDNNPDGKDKHEVRHNEVISGSMPEGQDEKREHRPAKKTF